MGHLERIPANPKPEGLEGNYLVFKEIHPDSSSIGICFVRGGEHRFTKADKPFIKLYLQDTTGAVIPGYIFDVDNFQAAGLELTRVINNVVQVNYKENYLAKVGLSVIIDKLELIAKPPAAMLDLYVGTMKEAKEKYNMLLAGLNQKLNMKVAIPFDICHASHMDYSQGKIGGLAIHYWDMFLSLETYAPKFSEDEQLALWGTFLLYIFTHSNFLKSQSKGEDDITLVTALTSHLQSYKTQLRVGEGVLELVHIFFGYAPKDIFVRLVVQVSEELVRADKEINLYRTLPITREGNAGYGTIRRYPDKKE